jgi:PTS system nitrogen regulatory IIA component
LPSHGKLKGIKSIICSFGRTSAGIDFQSIDEKPTYLFFLLLAPEDSASEHLQALARLSRLLKDDRMRKRLLEVDSKEDLYRIITEADAHYPSP